MFQIQKDHQIATNTTWFKAEERLGEMLFRRHIRAAGMLSRICVKTCDKAHMQQAQEASRDNRHVHSF